MKKVISALSALALLASLTACGKNADNGSGSGDSSAESSTDIQTMKAGTGDTVLTLYSFTKEVPEMMAKYIEMNPDFGKQYTVESTIIPTTEGAYQPALDMALSNGGKDAPDIYCAEAAFVLKYTQGAASKYAAPYDELGIDTQAEIDAAQIAPYAVDIGTNKDGKVVGLGYQATGGAFIYRRSIAKDVFGSDDPAAVSAAIGGGTQSWDTFWDAAEKLKAKGYGIVSGDGDIWHAVENSSDQGWIVNDKLHIDPKRAEFMDISMKLKENNYYNDTRDWNEAWFADMQGTGEKGILGFFGPAWLINYTMAEHCGGTKVGEGTYGDWGVCESPIGFFWGGTWLLANKDSEHKDAVGQFIDWVTLNTNEDGLQYMWANGTYNDAGTKDAVASAVVMNKSDGTVDFLGGQNMFDVFEPANAYANGKNLTPYDEDINSMWRDQVRQYTSGSKNKDEAIRAFKDQVSDTLDIEAE